MLRARATLDLADALTEELSRDDGASQRLLAEVEQPLEVVLGRDGSTSASPPTPTTSPSWSRTSPPR